MVGAGTATAVWDRNGEITDGGFVAVGAVTTSGGSATDDGSPAAFSASSRATCIHVAPIHQKDCISATSQIEIYKAFSSPTSYSTQVNQLFLKCKQPICNYI